MERDLIVMGGSAGALRPLSAILGGLPPRFQAAIFVVLHVGAQSTSSLSHVLGKATSLIAAYAIDGEPIVRGRIYVAPQGFHLTVQDSKVALFQGPHENGFRPAVDPLFRSAANTFGNRVIGVLLSGAMDDGTFGLANIKDAGGLVVVQHPNDADVPGMPLSAIQNVEVDHILPAEEIARILMDAVPKTAADQTLVPNGPAFKPRDVTLVSTPPDELAVSQGPPTIFSCPECGGALWEIREGDSFRYRCHTGHGFTPQTLLAEQNHHLELALWSAVRVLQERSALHRKLAASCAERGMNSTSYQYGERAADELKNAEVLREFINRARRPGEPAVPPFNS